MELNLGTVLQKDQEGVLKVTLMMGATPIYYYSRVVQEQDYHVKECLQFVCEMHENMLNKKNEVQRMCNECNIDARTCSEPSKKQTLMQAYNEGSDT